jgi:hypothetical protein
MRTGKLATTGFIYDTEDGTCLARVTDGGEVLDATTDGRQIGTIDHAGNVFDLNGAPVGHIRAAGQFDGDTPEAFRKLLRKGNDG